MRKHHLRPGPGDLRSCVFFTIFLRNWLLQNKWTLISSTATFPTSPYPFNGFHEVAAPNDYFNFGKNDSLYSYVTASLPYSVDTIFYKASSSSITFYVSQSQSSYAYLFETQDTLGHFHDTTVAQIITLNDTLLVLSFPSIEPVTTSLNGSGSTTYYPGTMIDTLKRWSTAFTVRNATAQERTRKDTFQVRIALETGNY